MSGVLAENVGRGDVLWVRGVTNRVGVHWQRAATTGAPFLDVDLTGWECWLNLTLPDGRRVLHWLCVCEPGRATATIPPDVTSDSEWAGRTTGEWRITGSRDGTVELLGWGYWHMA